MTLAELIKAAGEHTPAERLILAEERREESADLDPEVDTAWKAEFRRPIDAAESGQAQWVDGREALRIARERVAAYAHGRRKPGHFVHRFEDF